MAYTLEELFKLIGELTGYGHRSTTVHVTYNPAMKYDGFGESDGPDLNNWGYGVSVKLCMMEDVRVDAHHKDLKEALLLLAKAIPERLKDLNNRRGKAYNEAQQALAQFFAGKVL